MLNVKYKKMKHIHNKILICATLFSLPFGLQAQAEPDTTAVVTDSVYMVNTAFRKVAQTDLLSGVSVVNVDEMLNSNYTTYSLTNMLSLASGWNGTSIWGMDDYLVLIDGIPRDADNVMPSEIAQISFLKGANAVVLYGSRAAKGVVLITTKRGALNEKLKIDVRANVGFNVAKQLPNYLGSAEYMRYYNQAARGDNNWEDDPVYSDDQIAKYESNTNPYHYPDIDYYSSEYIKKAYSVEDAVMEFSGGSKSAHYYVNLNAYTQGDYLKIGEAKYNRTNRLSVRGNVDINLSKYISAYIDANATFYDAKSRKGDYWGVASKMRPNRPQNAAWMIPVDKISPEATDALALISTTDNIFDGKFIAGTTTDNANNVFAQIYAGGKTKWTSRQFQFDAGMRFDLSKLLEGLSLKTTLGMDFQTSYTTQFNPKYSYFVPKWDDETEMITKLTKQGDEDQDNGQQSISNSVDNRTLAGNVAFDYNRSFGQHNVSAMILANCYQQTRSGEYHAVANANLGFDLSYNFNHRYYAQFSAAEAHSAKLAEGHRNAFSPTGTIGWRLSNESFMENVLFLNNLLISASAGVVNEDADISSYYMYDGVWQKNSWGFTWYDGSNATTISPTRGENAKLEMIKRREVALNLKASMFDNFVDFDFTYFTNTMEGYVIGNKSDWPNHIVEFLPYLNNDDIKRKGLDFAVNFNKQINDFDVKLGVVGTYYKTEYTTIEETVTEEYQSSKGRPVDAMWGWECLGIFQSQDEIDNSPEQTFGKVRLGDLKYKDQNGDGVIDQYDRVYLGKSGSYGSPLTLGFNLKVKYKNFTLQALASAFTGAKGTKTSSYYWLSRDTKYSEIARDSWTPENPNAKYPALTTTNGNNNYIASDFWLYKYSKFTLDKVQLTYELPSSMFDGLFINGVTTYISGANLLTIAKERKHMEMNVGTKPQSRFFNIGLKANF